MKNWWDSIVTDNSHWLKFGVKAKKKKAPKWCFLQFLKIFTIWKTVGIAVSEQTALQNDLSQSNCWILQSCLGIVGFFDADKHQGRLPVDTIIFGEHGQECLDSQSDCRIIRRAINISKSASWIVLNYHMYKYLH